MDEKKEEQKMALSKKRMMSNVVPINKQDMKDKKEIELKEFEERVSGVFKFASSPVALLPEKERQSFDQIKETVKKYYQTDEYEDFYNVVTKYFNTESQPSDNYNPKSVGSYFTGCLIPTNIEGATEGVNNGCALLCAGSMPLPRRMNTVNFCSQNVIWCLHRINEVRDINNVRGTFEFLFLTKVSGSNDAILFLTYTSYEDFPGFTESEKDILTKLRIFNVKLLSYDKTGTEYKDLVGRVLKVSEIKTRDSEAIAPPPKAVLDKLKTNPSAAYVEGLTTPKDPILQMLQKTVCIFIVGLFLLLLYCAYRSLR